MLWTKFKNRIILKNLSIKICIILRVIQLKFFHSFFSIIIEMLAILMSYDVVRVFNILFPPRNISTGILKLCIFSRALLVQSVLIFNRKLPKNNSSTKKKTNSRNKKYFFLFRLHILSSSELINISHPMTQRHKQMNEVLSKIKKQKQKMHTNNIQTNKFQWTETATRQTMYTYVCNALVLHETNLCAYFSLVLILCVIAVVVVLFGCQSCMLLAQRPNVHSKIMCITIKKTENKEATAIYTKPTNTIYI